MKNLRLKQAIQTSKSFPLHLGSFCFGAPMIHRYSISSNVSSVDLRELLKPLTTQNPFSKRSWLINNPALDAKLPCVESLLFT
jgi:hypothetical protein